MMVPCIWNTSASPNRALELLQRLFTSGSAAWKSQLRPPLDDALQCLSFYTFIYTDMCTHPEETCFHHSDFYTLSSFLNDFLHALALAFREEPCPVFSSKTRCYGGESARQNCQRFSPDFPMTTFHIPPAIPCSTLPVSV